MMKNLGDASRIDSISNGFNFRATIDVLRLDLLHPVVSGNKWFKLQHYLAEAQQLRKTVLTFGGAFSNHIVATAFAAKSVGLKSVGVIRGEEQAMLSHTLKEAKDFGMKLCFVSREFYKSRTVPKEVLDKYGAENIYVIPEGGYGSKGVEGAKEILLRYDTSSYTHIVSAVGTGTTLAGLIMASDAHQKVMGISVLKNNYSLEYEIKNLLPAEKKREVTLLHDYHFGGYAKHTQALLDFMNAFYGTTGIPTDFVYTGKAFYATMDLVRRAYFSATDKILLVHTGGLQGNRSLPKGTLHFA